MNSLTIKLPKAVYAEAVLRKAAADYRGICKVEITDEGNAYGCRVSDSVAGLALTMQEYLNYLIEISNSESVHGHL